MKTWFHREVGDVRLTLGTKVLSHARSRAAREEKRGGATYFDGMNKQAAVVKAVFRGIARMSKAYTIEVGPFRATGVPAILAAVTGIVLASGVASALSRNAERLPETLREARGLAETLRPRQTPLNP